MKNCWEKPLKIEPPLPKKVSIANGDIVVIYSHFLFSIIRSYIFIKFIWSQIFVFRIQKLLLLFSLLILIQRWSSASRLWWAIIPRLSVWIIFVIFLQTYSFVAQWFVFLCTLVEMARLYSNEGLILFWVENFRHFHKPIFISISFGSIVDSHFYPFHLCLTFSFIKSLMHLRYFPFQFFSIPQFFVYFSLYKSQSYHHTA